MLLFAAVLLITFAATAQDKKTTKENKWKARARVIAWNHGRSPLALPPPPPEAREGVPPLQAPSLDLQRGRGRTRGGALAAAGTSRAARRTEHRRKGDGAWSFASLRTTTKLLPARKGGVCAA